MGALGIGLGLGMIRSTRPSSGREVYCPGLKAFTPLSVAALSSDRSSLSSGRTVAAALAWFAWESQAAMVCGTAKRLEISGSRAEAGRTCLSYTANHRSMRDKSR